MTTEATRVIFGEELVPGMVIEIRREVPQPPRHLAHGWYQDSPPSVETFYGSVLDVRHHGGVTAVIVALPNGDQDSVVQPSILPVRIKVTADAEVPDGP